ncbi:MAG: hypothetical protein AAF915_25015 [Cyanobacteria bacterium P01_D01_bin.50]
MQRFIKSAAKVSAASAIAFALAFVGGNSANAQPKGMPEGYLGIAGGAIKDVGLGGLNGRISFPRAKVSLRGSLLGGEIDCGFDDCGVGVFVPTVTYDIPVAKNTNIYLGAGYLSVAVSDDVNTFTGSEGILQAGAETGIGKKFVIYGDGNFYDGGSLWKLGLGYRL